MKLTEERKEIAIAEYAKTGNLSKAAKAAGVTRVTLWVEGKRNARFRKLLDNAKFVYTDALEAILDDRIQNARDGKDKASAILLMFKMKAEMPDKYREKIDQKIDGNIKIITGVPRPAKEKGKGGG